MSEDMYVDCKNEMAELQDMLEENKVKIIDALKTNEFWYVCKIGAEANLILGKLEVLKDMTLDYEYHNKQN